MVQVPGGTPAATVTPAPAIETSFAASTYVSEPNGISLAYPKRWAIGMPVPPTIFSVSEGGQVPVLNISVYSKGSMQKEVEAQRAANNMTNIKYVVQDQDFKLRDGKTVAKYSVSTADYSGATFKLRTYSITIEKGDKLISFAITTLDGMEDEALFKEIFNTVIVK